MSELDAADALLCQQIMAKMLAGSGLTMRDNHLEEAPSAAPAAAEPSTNAVGAHLAASGFRILHVPGRNETYPPPAPGKKKRVLVLDGDNDLDDEPVIRRSAAPATVVSDSDDEPPAATTTIPKAAEAKKARKHVDEADRKRKKEEKLLDAATKDEQRRIKAVEMRRKQREESESLCAQALGVFDAMHPLGHTPTPSERQAMRAKVTARRDECIEGRLVHELLKDRGEAEGEAPPSTLDKRVDQFLRDTNSGHVPKTAVSKRILALKRASAVPGVVRILRQREELNNPTWLPPRFDRDADTGAVRYRTEDGLQQKQGEQRAFWKEAARTKENRLATVRDELKQIALAREEQMAAARSGL